MKLSPRFATKMICGLAFSFCAVTAQADLYDDGLMAYTVGNYDEASRLLMEAAEQGNGGAEHMLMRLYSEGRVFAQNMEKETLKWTRRAAEQGIMQAQFELAKIHATRQGDMATAVAWYQKAAKQGHPEAFYKLGEIFEQGAKGVAADSNESVRLYQVAASEFDVYAQQGDADAQNMLAGMYHQAQGVRKNMELAIKWWEKAALQGHVLAQLNLGRLYAIGDDVPHDPNQAAYWLNLAAAKGVVEAESLLAALKRTDGTKIAMAM
jgi:hypothetical protein